MKLLKLNLLLQGVEVYEVRGRSKSFSFRKYIHRHIVVDKEMDYDDLNKTHPINGNKSEKEII